MRVAAVIPSFRQGSGGHGTVARLLSELSQLGHTVSIWLQDSEGRHAHEPERATVDSFRRFFAVDDVAVHADFKRWDGADVVLATGWQTVASMLLLPGASARAYLVQDYEPDFYGASAEALWAQQTYTEGLHCIAASPWLAELLRDRHGAQATHFDLAVDHSVYRPSGKPRQDDLIAFYARSVTPRRAVPLGLIALQELARRRSQVQIVLYGDSQLPDVPFAHRQLGVLSGPSLAELYSQATVGLVLSLTNPSLVGLEMLACGLPSVELASESMLATFGRHGPLKLSEPDPLELCNAIEQLLDDPAGRQLASREGVRAMAERTWTRAAIQVEGGLRVALAQAGNKHGVERFCSTELTPNQSTPDRRP